MKFFVPVHTVEGVPWDTALVEITDEDLDVIFRVSKVVNESNHSSVNRVDTLDFFKWARLYDSDPPEKVLVTKFATDGLSDLVNGDDRARVVTCEIVIAKDSVWWEFYVKHTDDRFDTEPVTLEYLVAQLAKEPV